MKYKSLGTDMSTPCTPAPSNMFDKRSCRERTGCKRECWPKTLKCPQCGGMFSSLKVLENIETHEKVSVCRECEAKLK